MSDPHRLLSKLSDGDDLERELLGSIQRADPPEHAKAEAWARLSTQIAAVALVGSAHGSAAAASAGAGQGAAAEGASAAAGAGAKSALAPIALKALGAKIAVALAVAGAAIGASAVWVHVRAAADHAVSSPPVTQAPAPTVTPNVDPAAAAPSEPVAAPSDPAPSDPEPQAASDSTAKPSAEQRRRDQLSAESSLLTQARAELRKGDARGAQQVLNKLQAQFPKGMLGQEREVLAIEVLAARGNATAAKHRAQAFIAAYPESPHSAQLSRFTDAP